MVKDLRRGCIATVVAAVLVLVACSGGGSGNTTPPPANNNAGNTPANNPGQQQQTTPNVKISVNKYESCHDKAQKKSTGPSDGLWDMKFDGAPTGTKVTVTFKSSIGDKQVTGEGVVGDNGQVTIRMPLQAFEEVLEVVSAHVEFPNGTSDDLSGSDVANLQKETVEPTSECDLEADATNDAAPN